MRENKKDNMIKNKNILQNYVEIKCFTTTA